MTTQFELPSPAAPPKRPEKPSAARRSIDLMVRRALETGAASSVEDLLDQLSGIPDRALFNALLAVLQLPHATMLCTSQVWEEKWGRRIASEQRPVVLLYPFGPVELVFDISQTERTDRARRLPFNETPFAMDPIAEAGEAVARIIAGVQDAGVKVVRARQGVRLAGKIRRVEDAGTVTLAADHPTQARRAVPIRWVTALNDSHPPTEQLATLAHELGHLFCGHVGADRGDAWPRRDVLDHTTREFEAESVARLVFRKIAPSVALPPYIERLIPPGQPMPDAGWTYVAQAADRVLALLGTFQASNHGPGR